MGNFSKLFYIFLLGSDIIRKRTNDEFLDEINKLNPTYTILSEYESCDKSVHCYCNIHNTYFDSIPYNLLKGKCGCESCRREKISKKNARTKLDFVNKLYKINPNIEVIGEYTQCKNKIECVCKIHNETFFSTPDHLIQGETGCKKCIDIKNHNSGLKLHGDFVNEMKCVNKDIQIIGEYTGAKQNIEVKCTRCGHIWSPTASSLLSGFGCPECTISRGEIKIKNYLEKYKINFEHPKKFNGLYGVGGRHLSYDFYLPDINLLIEYQGQFHDNTAPQQTSEQFTIQKEHDKRKSEYAKFNNICLLEIWHWDYKNIEKILDEIINNLETP